MTAKNVHNIKQQSLLGQFELGFEYNEPLTETKRQLKARTKK